MKNYKSKAASFLEKFNPRRIQFFSWLNNFESVIDHIELPDNKRVEFFLEMLEYPEMKEDIRNVLQITFKKKSINHTYEEVVSKFSAFHTGLPTTDFYRMRFQDRVQYKHETIKKYAESLEKLYSHCSYKNKYYLKIQFVRGLYEEQIRIFLNKHKNIEFDEALKKAVELGETLKVLEKEGKELETKSQETNEVVQ
ncbi:uncharacterized protein LOC122513167 [Polistes fuscatus]|uniref:uncharacterized protein LOC122513167 n=1 Tax=Polistes fuscatus TaxID=30207 RepID=UPI001CAA1A7C|nr:uncharacterized protein LOC122513167 [Polistes fuscatus]